LRDWWKDLSGLGVPVLPRVFSALFIFSEVEFDASDPWKVMKKIDDS